MKHDEFKTEIKADNTTTLKSINMKISALASNKPPSSYDQTSDDIIQFPLLKSPEKYPHASQFTKHISSITLEVETIIHIQKF